MNLNKLSNQMLRPKFFDDIFISKNLIKTSVCKSPLNYNKYDFYLKVIFKSNDNQPINYNPIELINFFKKNDDFKLVDWDDDKEFDFSQIYNVTILLKMSDNIINDFFKLLKINYNSINLHNNVSINILEEDFANFIIPNIIKNINVEIK